LPRSLIDVEVAREPLMDPARDLARAKRLLAARGEECRQARGIEVEKVRHHDAMRRARLQRA
jgi:hypothetical protein